MLSVLEATERDSHHEVLIARRLLLATRNSHQEVLLVLRAQIRDSHQEVLIEFGIQINPPKAKVLEGWVGVVKALGRTNSAHSSTLSPMVTDTCKSKGHPGQEEFNQPGGHAGDKQASMQRTKKAC